MRKVHGSEKAKLEDNGRLSLPKRFYYAIDESERDYLHLTIENDNCIVAYSNSGWEDRIEKLSKENYEDDREKLRQIRMMERRLEVKKIDKKGRFYLPPELKDRVNIDREVEILGTGSRIEIWSPEEFDKYEDKK